MREVLSMAAERRASPAWRYLFCLSAALLIAGCRDANPPPANPAQNVKDTNAAEPQPAPEAPPDAQAPPPPDPRIAIVQPSVDKGVAFLKARTETLASALARSDHPFFSSPVMLP